jgi:uncharacterized protein (DUF1778 family)
MNKTVSKGFRATPAEVALLSTASKLSRQSMSTFMLRAVLSECKKMLNELPPKQAAVLEKALDEAILGQPK